MHQHENIYILNSHCDANVLLLDWILIVVDLVADVVVEIADEWMATAAAASAAGNVFAVAAVAVNVFPAHSLSAAEVELVVAADAVGVFPTHLLSAAPVACNCTAKIVTFVAFVELVGAGQIDPCIKFLDILIAAPVAESDVVTSVGALAHAAPAAVIFSLFCGHKEHAFFLQLRIVEIFFVVQML